MENILSIAFYTANAGLNETLLGQLGWLALNQLQFDRIFMFSLGYCNT